MEPVHARFSFPWYYEDGVRQDEPSGRGMKGSPLANHVPPIATAVRMLLHYFSRDEKGCPASVIVSYYVAYSYTLFRSENPLGGES